MKKLFLFLNITLLSISTLFAQNKIKGNGIEKAELRKIKGYEGISLKGSFDVILTDKIQGEIKILAEENIIPLIQTKLVSKNLELFIKPNLNLSFKKAIIYVPAKGIHQIALIGSGDIKSKENLTARNFHIHLKGSGDVALEKLKTDKTIVNLEGSGDIKLKGISKDIEIKLKGSGDISAFDFITKNANVELLGSGDVEIHSKESFFGRIKGSGDITAKGNPTKILKRVKGSGKIKVF